MQGSQTSTRRDALGIAALAASMVVIGNEAGAAQPRLETRAETSAHPTREELARAARLYAGEFGGGVGVR
jgi:hypothetical protein